MEEPSITLEHKDNRGEIYSISLPGNRELMLLFYKAGVFRGGHSRDVHEVVVLLSGKMKYYKLPIGGDGIVGEGRTIILKEGDRSYNRAGEIHMGEFLEDSWVVEYKFAEKDAWKQVDYEPYRQMVRESAE